jgi:hypothetical protein
MSTECSIFRLHLVTISSANPPVSHPASQITKLLSSRSSIVRRDSNRTQRIASPRMLPDNFPPMTGAASPNRVGVVDGGKDQYGRAARGGVGGDGALPVGQTGGEGADSRRAVRDDGLASQVMRYAPSGNTRRLGRAGSRARSNAVSSRTARGISRSAGRRR